MTRFLLIGVWWSILTGAVVRAASDGEEVVVVYNRNVPESKEVARYYARQRQVPADQVLGFDITGTEHISRANYRDQIEHPLLRKLEANRWLVYEKAAEGNHGTVIDEVNVNGAAALGTLPLVKAKIRYAVLCYGVPYVIAEDTNIVEKAAEKIQLPLRRNEAAVDSELACLPMAKSGYILTGFTLNSMYLATNAAVLNPTNGLLIVARLDGPTPAIARGLVDKAMQAERDGLWGRAYFDARGFTNGPYLVGDEWIRNAARICRRQGYETILDDAPPTFPAAFPLSQVAFYAGWYDTHVSGPFTRDKVEFMPGAFAYHLHSYSARTLRDPTQNWVAPLLQKGVTATMGCVLEPYLEATPDIASFFARFLHGFTFGEAAYASMRALSWQITVVGDPLYRPFGRNPRELHEDLARRRSKLIEWSHLRVIDLNEALDTPAKEVMEYLEKLPETRGSGVLSEKLGNVYYACDRKVQAVAMYRRALVLDPSPQQKTRLMLTLSQWLADLEREREALEALRQFQDAFPDYPDPLAIWQRLSPLAQKLGEAELAEKCRQEIQRLSFR